MKKTTDSIWNWTKSGKSTVSHRGETVEILIPQWLRGDLENDPDGFLEQIKETIGARTLVAKFLQQAIIDLRSAVRPNDSKENPVEINEGEVVNISENWIMDEVKVPGKKAKDPSKMTPEELVEYLREQGWNNEALAALSKK